MRIEELILEGFKSYPVRTTIKGWDSSFNAITGLNGSGKSNILDAICFVLGITNMTSVRAQNLLDLIYKRGQAGVTKASVTIVFDNSDKSTSPFGFEGLRQITVTRQIAVGGLSKYLLNGHKSTLIIIQNLFQSVQLNINNPNFLIMQGKITKVLNMKPEEVLGMVEEAAGTRMFEERKDKAVKTMGKKDKKVEEMNELLKEEIEPKLESLRAEKRSFLTYQKITSELERLTRQVKAYEYVDYSSRVSKTSSSIEAQESELEKAKEMIGWLEGKKIKLEKEIEAVKQRRDKEIVKGGKIDKLTQEVGTLGLDVEKWKTKKSIHQDGMKEDKKKVTDLKKSSGALLKDRESKSALSNQFSTTYNTSKTAFDALSTKLASDEELLQTLLTGLTSSKNGDDAAGGYMGQLAEAKSRLNSAGTEEDQLKKKIQHSSKELKEKEPKARKAEMEGKGLVNSLEEMKKEKQDLEKKLADLKWNDESEAGVKEERANAEVKINELNNKLDHLRSRLPSGLNFTYTTPPGSFNPSSVRGPVASLIDLPESSHKYAMALEICAGSKLFNVVVDDEKVSSALLTKGQLKSRTTFLPLNKIQGSTATPAQLQMAQKLAPGKVHTALSLIRYSADLKPAMENVFSSTVICDDDASAELVSDKKCGLKAVTLRGDVYDPSGTLSGGSAPNGAGNLIKIQEVNRVEKQIQEWKVKIQAIQERLKKDAKVIEEFKNAKRLLEIKTHELGLLEEQVQGSNAARIIAEVEALKNNIENFKESIVSAQAKQKQAKDDIIRIEVEIDDFKNNKDSKLEDLKGSIAKQKKEIIKQSAALKTKQKEMQTAVLELDQLEQDVAKMDTDIEEAEASLVAGEEGLEELSAKLQEATDARNAAQEKLAREQEALQAFDQELKDLEFDIKSKAKEVSDNGLKITTYEHELSNIRQKHQKEKNHLVSLEKEFSWIIEEKKNFGKSGGPYDFEGMKMEDMRARAIELTDQQKGLKKKVNPKVMNMIDSVEKKESALKKMMSQVLKDKSKIEETIGELDRYKRDALVRTWEKVNGDFGSIFAELLPGNFAKLQAPEGRDITEGLEVKIRSLIALSLIMSLLQFKPAPMYILDEIDAALDLSHTQHIGQLFRNRFKGSQFIVVSLKEGLFTNANVLFKAKFVDGTSTVERTVTRSSSAQQYNDEDKENDATFAQDSSQLSQRSRKR